VAKFIDKGYTMNLKSVKASLPRSIFVPLVVEVLSADTLWMQIHVIVGVCK
jgi:hypothetical protein